MPCSALLLSCVNFVNRFIVPYFTVTIEVDGSKVKSIQWDEGCYTCKSEAWCVCVASLLPTALSLPR